MRYGVLQRYRLWDSLHPSVQMHLRSPAARSPELADVAIQTELLVTGATVCEAVEAAAREMGLAVRNLGASLEGEAITVARSLARIAHENVEERQAGVVVACGGESTVSLADGAEFSAGGPNQEVALALALPLPERDVAAVLIDTDGSDGGGRYAGAVVDAGTRARAEGLGIDLSGALAEHRSTAALDQLGDLIELGPTGTNVNDLVVMVTGDLNHN